MCDKTADRERRASLRSHLQADPVFGPPHPSDVAEVLTNADRERLARCARLETYEAGELVWAWGDTTRSVGVVLEGGLDVRRTCVAHGAPPMRRPPSEARASTRGRSTRNGERTFTFRRLGPGDALGYSTLAGEPHTADLVAVGPTCVAILEGEDLLPLLAARPGVALRVIGHLGNLVGLLTDEKSAALLDDVYARVKAWVLESLAPGQEVAIRHADVARIVGASRAKVSHALERLAREGLVALRRGFVRCLDRPPAPWRPGSRAEPSRGGGPLSARPGGAAADRSPGWVRGPGSSGGWRLGQNPRPDRPKGPGARHATSAPSGLGRGPPRPRRLRGRRGGRG